MTIGKRDKYEFVKPEIRILRIIEDKDPKLFKAFKDHAKAGCEDAKAMIAQVENPVRKDLSDVLPTFKTEAVKEYKAPRMDSFSGSYGKKEIIKLGDSSAEYVRQGVVGCTCGQEISKDDKSSYANVSDSSSGSYGTGKQKQTKSYGT